jgi:hypothetical protein
MTRHDLRDNSPLDPLMAALLNLYNQGAPYTPEQLATVYSDDIVFTDPLHRVNGIHALCSSLNRQYASITHCHFVPQGYWHCDDTHFLQWQMTLAHPSLNRGKRFHIEGISQLHSTLQPHGETRICLHRDYFDVGAMVYEHVPLLGRVIGALKRRLLS